MYKKIIIIPTILILFALSYGCQKNIEENKEEIVSARDDYTYSIMKKQIGELENKYEPLEISTIGKSHQDRNLYSITLGSGDQKIAVIGGVHGREGLTSLLIMKIIEIYAKFYQANQAIDDYDLKNLLNNTTLVFIPMLNPDGIEIAVNGIKHLKNKDFYINANQNNDNFERWKANARGVDLNKQFSADWVNTPSCDQPHFSDFKGPAPESEPESKALADFTRKENFSSVVCFHHSGRIIYWYYNQSEKDLKRDKNLAKKISAVNGYELVSPEDSDLQAAGFKDWFIKEFKKPGFTIEIGFKGKSDKPLPADKLNYYFNENKNVLLELADSL